MNFDRYFRYLDILRRPRIALAITLLGASILTGCASTSPNSQGLGSWLDKMDQASEKAKSMYYLGYAFSKGKGIERDDAKAVEWYHRAVKGGFKRPTFRLALAYRDGRGVKKNEKTAAAWARRSAELKNARGQYILGDAYATGRGIE